MDDELLTQIHALDASLRERKRTKHDRDLPFEELIFDRWERARSLDFGEGASIYASAHVLGQVSAGRGTWIGPYVMLDGSGGGIEIGEFCSISTGVQVYTHDTMRWALSAGKAAPETGGVHIGDCTHVGAGAVILRGVEIGDHCVIGAQAVVNSDVPPYSIALGVPTRVCGRVVIGNNGEIALEFDPG